MFSLVLLTPSEYGVANVLLALVGLYITYLLGVILYNLYGHPLSHYPGPISRAALHLPAAWSTLRGTSFSETKLLHDQYGSVVRVGPNELSYNSAQAWKDIYGLRPDRTELAKDPLYYRRIASVNIINSTQQEHRRLRKLLAPGFSDGALREQEPLLNIHWELLVSKLKRRINESASERVDLMAYYNFITFDIIGDLVLGEPFGALKEEVYHPWMRNVFESIKLLGLIRCVATYPILNFLFGILQKLLPSIASKRQAHLAFTARKINARMDRQADRHDIISTILKYNFSTDQSPLSRQEILSNLRTLLVAGSDTTATHLSGATWLLLKHPRVLNRVQDEVRAAFLSAEEITLQSVSDEQRLPYLNAVVQETLRLYPSVPTTLPRVTGKDGAMIDGKFVTGQVIVGVHHWSAYHSERNFALPEEFHPERWIPSERPDIFERDKKEAHQPFMLGPRICLGKSLALLEIRSILTRMLWHFEMKLLHESGNWMEQKEYTFWDKPALWVELRHKPTKILR